MKARISKAAQLRVEKDFERRMKKDGVKWGTKTYRLHQYLYFTGAMIALNGLNAYWTICIMSGREILKNPAEIELTQRRFGMTKKQAEKVIQ